MKPGGGVLVGAAGEKVGNRIMDGEKPLDLPRLCCKVRICVASLTFSKLILRGFFVANCAADRTLQQNRKLVPSLLASPSQQGESDHRRVGQSLFPESD
jgi:hypothetical protein